MDLQARPGGVTVLAINTSRTETHSLDFEGPADRYTLCATTEIRLNGEPLRLQGTRICRFSDPSECALVE